MTDPSVPLALREFDEDNRSIFTATRSLATVPPTQVAQSPVTGPSPAAHLSMDDSTSRRDTSTLPRDDLEALIDTFPLRAKGVKAQRARRQGVRYVLDWLEKAPGQTWQARWDESGVEAADDYIALIRASAPPARELGKASFSRVPMQGLVWIFTAGAIRPGYRWLYQAGLTRAHFHGLPVIDPEGLELVERTIASMDSEKPDRWKHTLPHLFRLTVHTGKKITDLTPEDWFEAYQAGKAVLSVPPSGGSYEVLYAASLFPPSAAPTLQQALVEGKRSVEAIVEKYGIESPAMRRLFTTYLRERSVSIAYNSLTGLASHLLKHFWRDLEIHHPGIDSLRLTPEVVGAWKERVRTIQDGRRAGQPRADAHAIFIAVRGFYYDVGNWAAADPDNWGEFAAPNPIIPSDGKAFAKMKRRQRARSHERTRERAPLLGKLWDAVSAERRLTGNLATAVEGTTIGSVFFVDGVRCERVTKKVGAAVRRRDDHPYVTRADTGKVHDVHLDEDVAFWTWAVIGILKETGIRIEELTELTHTSITSYRIPSTGELLPLLQIAPSKTDQERVLLISPELADILSRVISRVRDSNGRIPLVRRYDSRDRVTSEPLPYLLQRRVAKELRVTTDSFIRNQLQAAADTAGLRDGAGQPIRFQPHDFRRIFATEAIAAGLPIHIAAKVLGHESLDTTQIYNAIYDDEVIKHHRAFISRRRSLRPSREYREPSDEEWQEFLGHFERRKVELGICGRAYGTPCIHEHACIRCSMLQLDPSARVRLIEIIENLSDRILEARDHGWLGEIEGLEISLSGANEKLASLDRRSNDGPISLGLPGIGPPG